MGYGDHQVHREQQNGRERQNKNRSMTEQRSQYFILSDYAEGMSHYLQSITSVQSGHG
jgi:hypothetical protein